MSPNYSKTKLPEKPSFSVSEIARFLAVELHIKTDAAKKRIYRAIECGYIIGFKNFGSIRISRDDAQRVMKGEVV
jgi:hypothetical protein